VANTGLNVLSVSFRGLCVPQTIEEETKASNTLNWDGHIHHRHPIELMWGWQMNVTCTSFRATEANELALKCFTIRPEQHIAL